ncbi:unnamed protein product, partial [Caretta caretta]
GSLLSENVIFFQTNLNSGSLIEAMETTKNLKNICMNRIVAFKPDKENIETKLK